MSASRKVGEVLNGRYPIVGILGEGGMGAVYKATDLRSPRTWAVKEMTDNFATDVEHQQAVKDFQREAKLLADLEHPNLPRINEFFVDRGHYYLVMDLVEGKTWESVLEKGPQPLSAILDIVWQITDVLNYLHQQQSPIIFRDLKPANVMITPDGRVKLIDFGIARVFQADKRTDTRAMGTPGYAAPEQYGTGQSDARTDIYALGAMMHQAITGKDPSDDPFIFAPVSSLVPKVPASVSAIVAKAVETERDKRFPNVEALRAALFDLHNDPEAYDTLPTCLRTGILPKPQNRTTDVTAPKRGASPRPDSSPEPRVAGTKPAKDSGSCLPWAFMILLLLASFVPWVGLVAAVLAWVVVICSKGQRLALSVFALAVAVSSVVSSVFGTLAFNWLQAYVLN